MTSLQQGGLAPAGPGGAYRQSAIPPAVCSVAVQLVVVVCWLGGVLVQLVVVVVCGVTVQLVVVVCWLGGVWCDCAVSGGVCGGCIVVGGVWCVVCLCSWWWWLHCSCRWWCWSWPYS